MLQRLRKAQREESGFTLIELLIVIVILGILAAIVVFAVNGIQDKGKTSACKADVATVTVAAEAYDAQTGHYARSMSTLVKAGLLHSLPSTDNYTIVYRADPRGRSVSVSSKACGGDTSISAGSEPDSAYCQELGAALDTYQDLNLESLDDEGFNGLIGTFKKLSSVAPDGVNKDWDSYVETFSKLREILNNAGLQWSDLKALNAGELPRGISQEDADKIHQQLDEPFNSQAFQDASSDIDQTADALCGYSMDS